MPEGKEQEKGPRQAEKRRRRERGKSEASVKKTPFQYMKRRSAFFGEFDPDRRQIISFQDNI
jgi:hypothetical protein